MPDTLSFMNGLRENVVNQLQAANNLLDIVDELAEKAEEGIPLSPEKAKKMAEDIYKNTKKISDLAGSTGKSLVSMATKL